MKRKWNFLNTSHAWFTMATAVAYNRRFRFKFHIVPWSLCVSETRDVCMGTSPNSLSELLSTQARTCVTCVLYKLRQAKNFILRIFTDKPPPFSHARFIFEDTTLWHAYLPIFIRGMWVRRDRAAGGQRSWSCIALCLVLIDPSQTSSYLQLLRVRIVTHNKVTSY